MSDDVGESPIPWGLVERVNRTKTVRTTMQISLPIELRARMAQAALDLGCSKLTLIRAAISQFLLAHEEARSSGQKMAYAATSEVAPPVTGRKPVEASELTGTEPEPETTPLPNQLGPERVPAVPEQMPGPKRSRAKKGRAQ